MSKIEAVLDLCRKAEAEKAERERLAAERAIATIKKYGAKFADGWWTVQCMHCEDLLMVTEKGIVDGTSSECPTIQAILREARGAE